MDRLQWRVLYRQFLFRVFDPEVLSAQAKGDATRLLGQFATLLIFFSVAGSLAALFIFDSNAKRDPGSTGLIFIMAVQHFLIATTMLVVGLFAVLSWDSTFPDQRDALVLAPLPVRARTIFLAKVMAVAVSLGLTIVLLHSGLGLILPLLFASRATPTALPALSFDATTVPVTAHDLQGVMDRDLKQALTSGDLAPGTGAGLAIGVWKNGERRVFTYGAAKPDSLFEIASISKTFTGVMLAQMVAKGEVRLDEPVRELLPAGTVTKPAGPEITLLDLATHRSGLPPMPDNFSRADLVNSWADYGPPQLYAYLASRGVAKRADAAFAYSNLGVGLLGQVLADRAGKTYADQLKTKITDPLGMTDTVLKLSSEQQLRFLPGYDDHHRRLPEFHRDGALAGAGAILSTAGDMMTFLEANLHPEAAGSLSRALALSHELHERMNGIGQIALVWAFDADTGTYWHNGATSGFTSHAFFNPRMNSAVVVLLNTGPNVLLTPDGIAEHIRQRLSGEPAISLETVLIPASGGLRGILRSFGAYWFTMIAAGVFVYGSILGVQGLAALLLPRRRFLRLSGYLQLAAIGLIVGVYFLQPGFGGLNTINSIGRAMQILPSYWFLALYQQLNGSMHPAMAPLARRAWMALAAVTCLTPAVYTLSYWRTLRLIVEEPDIVSGSRRWGWLPRFGNQAQTAIGQFSVRTLARSRQHRLILGFYLGIGLALTCLMLKGSDIAMGDSVRDESMLVWSASILVWSASILVMVLATLGTRVAFALPLDLRANWILRVIGVRGGLQTVAANRRALLLLSVAPVWLLTAVVCFALWPGRQNGGHLVVLGLLGMILADLCLLRFRKIPFTCSWLPGKSRFHMVFLGALGALMAGQKVVLIERRSLQETGSMIVMLAVLGAAWFCVRRTTMTLAKREEQELQFEDEEPPLVMGLGLYRDGVMPIEPPQSTRTL